MTVEDLLGRMTSREMAEWMAFFRIEPFGEERADARAGVIASTVANVNRGRNSKAFSPADFMLFSDRPGKDKALSAELLNFFKNRSA